MGIRRGWSAVLLAGVVAVAYAQLPTQQAAQPRPKLVNLNVVALDGHDQPVPDLTAADIQLTDAGKPQQIVFFQHHAEQLAAVQLGPREFSNRAAGRPSHATLILFDMLNDSFGASGAAQSELVHALERLESGEDLYLYLLTRTGRLFGVRPLPGGEEPAAAGPKEWTKQAKSVVEAAMKTNYGLRPPDVDVTVRVTMTYNALGLLARRLEEIPGRKSLVWITHGVPISLSPYAVGGGGGGGRGSAAAPAAVVDDFVDYLPYLRRLSDTMDRCDVAIYPVQQTPPGMAMQGTPEAQYSGLGSQETLEQFADLTGGRSKGIGSIAATLRQAMKDVRNTYQIGYLPPDDNWDGKFHKLRVTTKRKGVHLQSKTGYYAFAEDPPGEQDAIGAVVGSPVDAGEIGVRVRTTTSAKDPTIVHFAARIDAADIALLRQGDRYSAALQVALAGYGANGQPEVSKPFPLDLTFTGAERDAALKNGIPYENDVKLGAPVRQVRLIVFDSLLGSAGSVTMPVEKMR